MNILQKLVFAAKLKNNITKLEKAIAEEKKMGYDALGAALAGAAVVAPYLAFHALRYKACVSILVLISL